MSDRDEDLALTLPLAGIQWIEASAGTGKTYALAGVFVRLIVEQRLQVRDILVVTYTRAAADELRLRLRERLNLCARIASQDSAPAADESAETVFCRTLIERAIAPDQPRAEIARRLRLAALSLDEAQISTVHAFCQRALREHGWGAGLPPLDGDLVENERRAYDAIARNIWRAHAVSDDRLAWQALNALVASSDEFARIVWELRDEDTRLEPTPAETEGALRAAADSPETLRKLGVHVVRRSAETARRRNEETKRAQRRYSYDDLIVQLHRLVTTAPDAAAALARQFRAALVDECQDSDARQFEIFRTIYAGRGLLCLIGDPKQAIYRFRGGDVNAYLRARADAAQAHSLTRNFRSAPGLVVAIGRLYRTDADAFGDPRIRFEPIRAAGAARDDDLLIDGRPQPPLQLWRLATKDVGNKDRGKELLAAGCAQEIFALLDRARRGEAQLRRRGADGIARHDALRAEDIAVLVFANDEARAMQRALARRGVPSVVVSRESVFRSPEARELLTILRALVAFDEALLRGALSTRLLGGTLARIIESTRDPALWHAQIAEFVRWRDRWRRHGVLALIERIAEQRSAELRATEGGERRLTNLLHLAELLQQESASLDGERALTDWLAQRIANADDDREDEQLRLESDADRVHIATLHRSKGLEYPIVFLPFVPLRSNSRKDPYRTFYRDDRRVVHLCGVADAADADSSARQVQEERGERLRLLYVGLTRARSACYVACGAIGQRTGDAPALLHLLGLASDKADVDARLRALADESGGTIALHDLPPAGSERLRQDAAESQLSVRQATRQVRERRGMYSYSRLSAAATGEEPGVDEAPVGAIAAVEAGYPNALQGARFGTAFHEIMEHVDRAAWRGAPSSDQLDAIETVLQRHALIAGDRPRIVRIVADLVAATLQSPLPFGARLSDLAPHQLRAEMPFHFAIGAADTERWLDLLHAHGYANARRQFAPESLSGLMTGVLDAVVLHEGRYWVIDYKTNRLGTEPRDYGRERLAAAVRDAEYDLQYLIYLTALHRWLRARVPRYDYERDIGGALYLFVRGMDASGESGIHVDKPPRDLIEAMDALFAPAKAAA
ncbi:MAG TPA: UvrD-helicase domain-containing protein [Rudaea sp.]